MIAGSKNIKGKKSHKQSQTLKYQQKDSTSHQTMEEDYQTPQYQNQNQNYQPQQESQLIQQEQEQQQEEEELQLIQQQQQYESELVQQQFNQISPQSIQQSPQPQQSRQSPQPGKQSKSNHNIPSSIKIPSSNVSNVSNAPQKQHPIQKLKKTQPPPQQKYPCQISINQLNTIVNRIFLSLIDRPQSHHQQQSQLNQQKHPIIIEEKDEDNCYYNNQAKSHPTIKQPTEIQSNIYLLLKSLYLKQHSPTLQTSQLSTQFLLKDEEIVVSMKDLNLIHQDLDFWNKESMSAIYSFDFKSFTNNSNGNNGNNINNTDNTHNTDTDNNNIAINQSNNRIQHYQANSKSTIEYDLLRVSNAVSGVSGQQDKPNKQHKQNKQSLRIIKAKQQYINKNLQSLLLQQSQTPSSQLTSYTTSTLSQKIKKCFCLWNRTPTQNRIHTTTHFQLYCGKNREEDKLRREEEMEKLGGETKNKNSSWSDQNIYSGESYNIISNHLDNKLFQEVYSQKLQSCKEIAHAYVFSGYGYRRYVHHGFDLEMRFYRAYLTSMMRVVFRQLQKFVFQSSIYKKMYNIQNYDIPQNIYNPPEDRLPDNPRERVRYKQFHCLIRPLYHVQKNFSKYIVEIWHKLFRVTFNLDQSTIEDKNNSGRQIPLVSVQKAEDQLTEQEIVDCYITIRKRIKQIMNERMITDMKRMGLSHAQTLQIQKKNSALAKLQGNEEDYLQNESHYGMPYDEEDGENIREEEEETLQQDYNYTKDKKKRKLTYAQKFYRK